MGLPLSLSKTTSFAWWLRHLPWEQKIQRLIPALGVGIFPSRTSDFKIGTPVAAPPGAWSYRVSAGTGGPGVSIL